MPAYARREIVREGEVGIYHCIHRCVRRTFLCGEDSYTGRSYEHRKIWIRDRLEELAEIFAVDVFGYAVMCNHMHVIVRIRPDVANLWSVEEVTQRWWRLYPRRRDDRGRPAEPTEEDLQGVLDRQGGGMAAANKLRDRLANLSWFMRCIAEPIARRANREDECTGRFWEGRFKSQALLDEQAVLTCSIYVDLNPIRAGRALTPETSEFTSARDRIEARQAQEKIKGLVRLASSVQEPENEAKIGKAIAELERESTRDHWLCSIGAETGFLPSLDTDTYLQLLDWTGRSLALGKRGSIPDHLPPILERLGFEVERWMKTVTSYGRWFRRAVGSATAMCKAAVRAGRHWFQGIAHARWAFGAT